MAGDLSYGPQHVAVSDSEVTVRAAGLWLYSHRSAPFV